MTGRKKTRKIRIGGKAIGGDSPVLVQSMCNTKTVDADSTITQIHRLEEAGCEMIRVAVPDEESAHALKKIRENISIPLVADIHFDYRLAVLASKNCDKLRINPGNIGSDDNVGKVISAASDNGVAIRIGVNLGSLDREIEKRLGRGPDALAESAMQYVRLFEKKGFYDSVVSLKASDVPTMIASNRRFSEISDYPLHLGVTEAGTLMSGTIRSAVGIGSLLSEGIGDTIRVSLTDDPVKEIGVAYEILQSLDIRKTRRTIVSCPTCARTHGDLIGIAQKIEKATEKLRKPLTIAVMGCEVNGPGEARHADVGLALGKDSCFIFRKGRVVRKLGKDEDLVKALLDEIDEL